MYMYASACTLLYACNCLAMFEEGRSYTGYCPQLLSTLFIDLLYLLID